MKRRIAGLDFVGGAGGCSAGGNGEKPKEEVVEPASPEEKMPRVRPLIESRLTQSSGSI
jgi:hypothetical protein